MNLKGKIILITGASYGIGKACANFFANLGANLILTYYTNKELCLNTKEELQNKYNIKIDTIKLDLTCEDEIKKVYDFVNNQYGHLDILINNAALSLDSFYLDKTKEEFMKVLETNLVGTFLMVKYFNKISNYIFNISSTDGIDTGSSYNIDYACSKASINLMTKYLSEFDKETKYYSICPNWVNTEPIKKMNQTYLNEELKRIKQDKLINPETIPKVIFKCIKDNYESGKIIRIDGDINE